MSKSTSKYIALLRGINVGRNKRVGMADLRAVFDSMGLAEPRTLLATGNVVFEAPEEKPGTLVDRIETALAEALGFEVGVTVRTAEEIRHLVDADPFAGIEVTPDTRLYVSFLREPPTADLALPHEVPEQDFRILSCVGKEVVSVLTLGGGGRTTESMGILEREYGKGITTRNWNTVLKMHALMQS